MVIKTMSERREMVNRNKDDIFGSPGTYECRVCGLELDDGRKQYCSKKCRKVAYAVYRMFRWRAVRKKVLERDDHSCQLCGWSPEDEENPARHEHKLHADHIISLSQGGSPLDSRNLMTVCKDCHIEKGVKEGDFSGSNDGKVSGYSVGLRIDEDSMPAVPLWEYLPISSSRGKVSGNTFSREGDQCFRCPKCGDWVRVEEGIEGETVCERCDSSIVLQAVALKE